MCLANAGAQATRKSTKRSKRLGIVSALVRVASLLLVGDDGN
jgi:hypothetical protein